jgi:hypothetical protein
MTVQMNETFAAALREVLVSNAEVADSPNRSFLPHKRWIVRAGVAVAIVVGGGGIAYATGAFSVVPGGDVTTPLATPVPVVGIGKQTVDLGTPPAGANAVTISLTCLTAGTFVFPDGGSEICNGPDDGQHPGIDSVPLTPRQDSITITATPGARWRLTAVYSTVTTTPWGVNASGQTYGAANQHGTPDLVAVIATNRRTGYVYANQLYPPPPKTRSQAAAENNAAPRTFTVYESDGKTAIGRFISPTAPGAMGATTPATTPSATSTTTTP